MKRRIKLLTSIASLAIAMSLLALGVYASATARLININGSVSFEVSNVAATVTVRNTPATSLAVDSATFSVKLDKSFEVGDTTQAAETAAALGAIAFTESAVYYYIEVSITNNFTSGGRKIEVIAPAATNPATYLTVARTTPSGSLDGNNQLAAEATIVYRYTYTLNPNFSGNISSTPINLQFSLKAV